METTDYCSYELSKALKAAGFDEPCDHYYCAFDNETDVRFWSIHPAQSHNGFANPKDKVIAAAPTLWLAQKWLREKHHISVRVSYIAYHKAWFADWLNLDSREFDDTDATFATYEEALSEGIETALELIIHK
ncbi:MAG: hypothetical protein J6C81_06410 [Muribaculaceae bacterium]|nr:hypothetical protein [Muribaculaceae bacterium]